MIAYKDFLSEKQRRAIGDGFEPTWMPDVAFDFQQHLATWNCIMGRSATFADCGLGKTLIELIWAENVRRHTNKPVLGLTPLAVAGQMQREAEKFGIEARVSRDGTVHPNITITNYEKLHLFNPSDFGGVFGDESSILKNFDGATKEDVTRFAKQVKYRLLATATAAPNDYFELGTSSEALGYLGYQDMLGKFFKDDTTKDYLGWGRKTYRFRGHAEKPFWRWVCSWARACRKPSDLGFSDERFNLPPLIEREHCVQNSTPRPGFLFSVPAGDLREQRQERRITMQERCEAAADIATACDGASVIWGHLNPECDLLETLIPDCRQVHGGQSDEEKEELLTAFATGQLKRLVTKPKIGCFGLNWQHCQNVIAFPSHSYEQYYQLVRRCWRFGQKLPVTVTVVTTEGEQRVLANLQRKARQCDQMFTNLVGYMNDALRVDDGWHFDKREVMPSWL